MKITHRIFALFLCLVLLMVAASPALTVFAVSFPECDCGNTSTDLTTHTDSCAKKSYIRNTYIKNNTAEQIYADWYSLDSDIKTAVLTFLSWDDYAKLMALTTLINSGSPSDSYPTTGSENIAVDLSIPAGAFPEGTVPNITPIDAKDYCSDIESAIYGIDESSEVLALYAFDISFTNNGAEVQPAEAIEITFTVPAALVPGEAQVVYVYHIGDDGSVDGLRAFYNIDVTAQDTYTIIAENFSSYVIAYTGKKYQATLLKNALKGDTDYSIVTLPATLYDYNDSFDGFLKEKANGKDYFYFWTGGGNTSFRPNDGAAAATMGILKETLDANGIPRMAYGHNNGKYIFDTNDYTGKTVYDNVNFEFIYNNKTGYYEYDSSLNHAQLNGNTVELYTDTMGPYNFFSMFTPKENGITYNQVTNKTGTYPAIKFKTNGDDAYVILDAVDAEITDKNKFLYIRMRSDKAEANGLSLYLDISSNNFNENHKISLDMKTGWNEYYFDLSSYKGKTLQQIRIDTGTKKNVNIEFESIGFVNATGSTLSSDMSKAGFYPFIDIVKSYPNRYNEFDLDDWKSKLGTEYTQRRATRAYYNEILSGYDACPTNPLFHFGVSMELEVYVPVDKHTDNGDEIEFLFTGDDDLWVFIDNKLALDVGGAHTEVSGSINLTTGDVYVNKARSITSVTTVEKNETGDYSGTLDASLCTPGYHTVKIFYLERASTGSNCRFYFNLPTVPTGDVEVSKEVVDESGLVDLDSFEFDYTITVDGSDYANKSYQVVTYKDNGDPIAMQSATTDSNGGFTLKHNQTAYFNDIDENVTVSVEEVKDSRFTTTVNGKNDWSDEKITGADTTVSFDFVNTVILTSIVIEKTASPMSSDVDAAENQSFIFHVSGNDDMTSGVDVSLVISILPGDLTGDNGSNSATITNIPLGSYTVTEDPNWSWRYEPVEGTSTELTKTAVEESQADYDTNNKFSFQNERKEIYWLSGDNIACNEWCADGKVKREDGTE